MRHFQNKRISTTAVVLSVAIICLGGNASAGERSYQQGIIGMNGQQGIAEMNGVSSPPPTQRFYYQQRQPSGKQQGIIGMNGVVNQPPTQNYRQRNAYKIPRQTSGNTSTRTGMRCCRVGEVIACKHCPLNPTGDAMKYK